MGSLYVIAEDAELGPVKIGMTFDRGGKVGRGGLNIGNWRQLIVLERIGSDVDTVRWREWLTHHRLRNVHVRGEWFDARPLAGGDWARFLDDVWLGTIDGLHPLPLGAAGHQILMVRQPAAPFRHFLIECSCGAVVDGQPGKSLPTALTNYALEHLGLSRKHSTVGELRVEPAQKAFNLHRYEGR